MSDDKDFEKAKETLLKINEIVAQMDPAVRVASFEILVSRYLGHPNAAAAAAINPKPASDLATGEAAPDTSELGAFISSFDTSKPNEAVMVLVAWLYSNYGVYAISAKEIKELADTCGLTVPVRPDNTMRYAKENNKNVFTQQAKGWQLTVSGELYMKNTFKVKKGNRSLPAA